MNNQYSNNYPPQQQPYQPQQGYQQPYGLQQEPPVTVGEWMLTLFLTWIPLVGLIMLFVWAFGSNTSVSKANWAKAQLIFMLIGIVFIFLFIGVIASVVGSIFR